MTASPPIFLFSAGWRCGGTWLSRMLLPRCLLWGEPYGHAGLVSGLVAPQTCFTPSWPPPQFFYQGEGASDLVRLFVAHLFPPPERLVEAQQAWFEKLFAAPAQDAGFAGWGVREPRLTSAHARAIRELFPEAKLLFLHRSPYDAYRALAARQRAGWKWYLQWPDRPVTLQSFGRHWRTQVEGFTQAAAELDLCVVRYDELVKGELERIEDYLGFPLSREAWKLRPDDGGPPSPPPLTAEEFAALQREVEPVAQELGYEPGESYAEPKVASTQGNDRSQCAVLVPVGSHIEPACEEALLELERCGYVVRRVRGYSAIDQGRNQMATDALADGFAETMWIDSDMAFDPDAVDRIRAHNLPICCGIATKKGKRELAAHVLPGTEQIVFGAGGGLLELKFAGTGFLHVRADVYRTLQKELDLPLCNTRWPRPMVPYFQPMIYEDDGFPWYLAEDYAFCARARKCGFRILADTTIRLGHIGGYAFSWEDAGEARQRHETYTYHLSGNNRTAPPPREDT